MGLHQTLRALRRPFLTATVANSIGENFPANLEAQTYLVVESPVVKFIDNVADSLLLGEPYARQFDFQPQFIEHFAPFRFVYLHPHPST